MKTIGTISYKRLWQIGAGQGLNSEVYLIDELQLGGKMAAKEIDKTKFRDPKEYFEEAQRMFATAHPNVVAVQYTCETCDKIALIMPYFKKGSLTDRIKDRPLPLGEALRVAQGVLAGVAQIHLRNFVHFDIKPSNILFSDKELPMVADFGQSRAISPTTGLVSVPPMYNLARPPETITTGMATKAADIYHVGQLLYRCLNGEEFYRSQIPSGDLLPAAIAKGKFPDRKRFLPHVPNGLRRVVRKALKVNAAERYQSAVEMADALSRVEIPLDWSIEPILPKGFRWRAKRPGQCDLVVELHEQRAAWNVSTFTEVPGQQPRAKDRAVNWRSGLSLADAFQHLDGVFEWLQQ